jgi:hypothetical protein
MMFQETLAAARARGNRREAELTVRGERFEVQLWRRNL